MSFYNSFSSINLGASKKSFNIQRDPNQFDKFPQSNQNCTPSVASGFAPLSLGLLPTPSPYSQASIGLSYRHSLTKTFKRPDPEIHQQRHLHRRFLSRALNRYQQHLAAPHTPNSRCEENLIQWREQTYILEDNYPAQKVKMAKQGAVASMIDLGQLLDDEDWGSGDQDGDQQSNRDQ